MKKSIIATAAACLILTACANGTDNLSAEDSSAAVTSAAETAVSSVSETETETFAESNSTVSSADKTETETQPAATETEVSDYDDSFMEKNYSDSRAAYTAAYKFHENNGYIHGVWFGNINGSGNEEMIIAFNPFGYNVIYSYENGQLFELELDVMSSWGGTWFITEENQILNEYFYGHTTGTFGAEDIALYEWGENGYEPVLKLFRESGYYDSEIDDFQYNICFINDEETDLETFEAKLSELYALRDSHMDFPFVEKTIDDEENPEFNKLLQEHLNY